MLTHTDASRSHPRRSGLLRALLPAALLSAAFLPALLDGWESDAARRFALRAVATVPPSSTPLYAERFIEMNPASRSLHVPALTELANGDLLAVWKAAKSEDRAVTFNAATYDRRAGSWGPVRLVTTSRRTESELGRVVTTLTNPVLVTAPDGTVSLLYVTAWGKWSTAAITLKTSTDRGETWTAARRIVTSPVANLGTLVKTAPVLYTDGSFGVPAYQELLGVLPQLLHFSAGGELLDKRRIDRSQVAMQPSIVPLHAREAVAFMRNSAKGSILLARTGDAGRSWSPVRPIGLPNPDSAVMGLRLQDGGVLLVFNNSATSRDSLALALSRDGGERWVVLHGFEADMRDGHGALENFSYPYVIQSSDGIVHVVYVWRVTRVKHVSFNEAWIRGLER